MSEPIRPPHSRDTVEERTNNRRSAEPDYPVEAYPTLSYGFPEDIDPIPVRITETLPRERVLVDWLPQSGTATADRRQQITADNRQRRRTVVCNTDAANTLYITNDPNAGNASFAYALPFGKREEFLHNTGMWVFAGPTLTATYTVFSEFEVDE